MSIGEIFWFPETTLWLSTGPFQTSRSYRLSGILCYLDIFRMWMCCLGYCTFVGLWWHKLYKSPGFFLYIVDNFFESNTNVKEIIFNRVIIIIYGKCFTIILHVMILNMRNQKFKCSCSIKIWIIFQKLNCKKKIFALELVHFQQQFENHSFSYSYFLLSLHWKKNQRNVIC